MMADKHEELKIFDVLLFFDPDCEKVLHDTLKRFDELKISVGEDGTESRPHITMVRCSFRGASPIACIKNLAENTETIPISLSGLDFSMEEHYKCRFSLRPTPTLSLLDIHSRFCKELEAAGGVILEDFCPGYWTARCPITRAFKFYLLKNVHSDLIRDLKLPIAANITEVGLVEIVPGGGIQESFFCKLSGITPVDYGVQLYFDEKLYAEIIEIREWFRMLHIDNKLPVDQRPCLSILRFSLKDLGPSAVKDLVLNFAANSTITPVSLALVNVSCGSDGSASLFVEPTPSRSLNNLHEQLCKQLKMAGAVIPRGFQPQSWIAQCTVAEGLKLSEMNKVHRSIINNLTLPINGMGVEIGFVKFGGGQLDSSWTARLRGREVESGDNLSPVGTEVRLIFSSDLEKLLDKVKQDAYLMKMTVNPAAQSYLNLVHCSSPPSELMALLEELSTCTKPVPVSLSIEEETFQGGGFQFYVLPTNSEVPALQRKLYERITMAGVKASELRSCRFTMARYTPMEDYMKVAKKLHAPLNGHGVELRLVRVFKSQRTSCHVFEQMWSYKLRNN